MDEQSTPKSKPGKAITVEHRSGRIVRKSNKEVGYRIKSGRLSLLARKVLNVLLYTAQTLRDKEDEDGRWCVPIAGVVRDIKFDDRNYRLLREALEELQEVRIVRPAREGGITSEVLIPSFTLDNIVHPGNENLQKGQKKRGGALMLWFMLPPELKKQLLDPDEYTRLPLVYMANLKTVASLALYEVCRRYVTNPGGVTHRDAWENWYYVLTGEPLGSPVQEYKYFKRNHLKRAEAEVNALTDIDVALIEFKEGRFVRDIQFTVKLKAQGTLGFAPAPVDMGVLSRITELGASLSDAERLAHKYPEKELLAALDATEARAANSTMEPLASAEAYLRKALSSGFGLAQQQLLETKAKALEEKRAAVAATAAETRMAEEAAAARAEATSSEALAKYDLLTEREKAAQRAQFLIARPRAKAFEEGSKAFRKALGAWLAASGGGPI